MRALAAFALVGACLSIAVASAPVLAGDKDVAFDHTRLARKALEGYIRPGYARFAKAAKELQGVVSSQCGGAKAGGQRKLRDAFDAVVTAWGRMEPITFGPVAVEQRLERIMFWPDRRGIGARQVATALRERASDVLDAQRLSQKSVAMQGLPAFETVLFADRDGGKKDKQDVQFRCGFAKAIASNLAEIAADLSADWTKPEGYSKSWLTPGPADPHYLKPEETTIALAKALDLGLEKVRDQRVGGPLGLTPQRRKIAPALGKSGRSMRLIVANIEGLRRLYVEGGMEQALIDAKGGDPENTMALARLVSKELATARGTAAALLDVKTPFEGEAASRLIALGFPLKNARATAAELLADVTGLPLGFNASDGD